MHSRLLVGLLLASATACASLPSTSERQCQPGSRCEVDGVLVVESLWQASLDKKNECVALALPESFFSRRDEFNGKRARVIGEAFSQPSDAPGTFSYSYEVEGMRVNINLCKTALIVDEIRTGNGTFWKKP